MCTYTQDVRWRCDDPACPYHHFRFLLTKDGTTLDVDDRERLAP
jgi:hypothetical protein